MKPGETLEAWVIYNGKVCQAKCYKQQGDIWPSADTENLVEGLQKARATLNTRLWWLCDGDRVVFVYCSPDEIFPSKVCAYSRFLMDSADEKDAAAKKYQRVRKEYHRLVKEHIDSGVHRVLGHAQRGEDEGRAV